MHAQSWQTCDADIRAFVQRFIRLTTDWLGAANVTGVYLHGSLATGSYYRPKSDIDLLIVVPDRLDGGMAAGLNLAIARLAEKRPTVGSLEVSAMTADTAARVPIPTPYELSYGTGRTDGDLPAHLFCVRRRGVCLYGRPIAEVFGDVSREAFLRAILADAGEILEGERLLEIPYYGVLNLCRVLQALTDREVYPYSKDEGGAWGLRRLPERFRPLIAAALDVYHAETPVREAQRETGGVRWNREDLLAFRDYAREWLSASGLPNGSG